MNLLCVPLLRFPQFVIFKEAARSAPFDFSCILLGEAVSARSRFSFISARPAVTRSMICFWKDSGGSGNLQAAQLFGLILSLPDNLSA